MITMKKRTFIQLLLMFVFIQIWANTDDVRWPNYVATTGIVGVNTSEDYPNLFDDDANTKWCVTGVRGTIYVEFDATRSIMPTGYVLTTAKEANACPERNPQSWVLKGKNSKGGNWTILETITNGALPTDNCSSKSFTLSMMSTTYRYYRLEITSLVSGDIFQLSEFGLLVNDANGDVMEEEPIEENPTEEADVLTLGCNGGSPLFADCPLDSVFIGRNISYPTNAEQGYSPFYRNTSLRSVHISNVETEVSPNEFYGCTNLKNVRLGDGITIIGYWAFSGCS